MIIFEDPITNAILVGMGILKGSELIGEMVGLCWLYGKDWYRGPKAPLSIINQPYIPKSEARTELFDASARYETKVFGD